MHRIEPERYHLRSLRELSTPRLLVYQDELDRNVDAMQSALEAIVPGSGFGHLMPHAKTHKSSWVTRRLIARGIKSFKATPNELDMLLGCGATDVFVAYPPLPHEARRIAAHIHEDPRLSLSSQIATAAHARFLQEAAERAGVEIPCFLDLDVGNRRTGASAEQLLELARLVSRDERFSRVKICGLHAYDGHNNSADAGERCALAEDLMDQVARCWQALKASGIPGDRIVAGGSPPFREDLDLLVRRHGINARVQVSPGTWVYWDSKYEGILPGIFSCAALILAQVMDRPSERLVTLNLGHKRWAIDQGPVETFSVPGLSFRSVSEEHTVLAVADSVPVPEIGDPILIAPRHVCATVNLWERFTLVGRGGEIIAESLRVDARNR